MFKSDLDGQLKEVLNSFRAEIAALRTGRASTALIENLKVEAYPGAPPLTVRELAGISVPEVHLVVIEPWDKSVLPALEKALRTAPGLGGSPVVDGQIIRLPLPSLSEERRRETVKLLGTILEKYRQEVRDLRQATLRELENREKKGEMGEDEMFAEKKRVEEAIKRVNLELEKLGGEKEAEVLRV